MAFITEVRLAGLPGSISTDAGPKVVARVLRIPAPVTPSWLTVYRANAVDAGSASPSVSAGQDPSSDDGEVSVFALHEFQIP
ncbi:MAG: hypothetical protein IH627_00975 [Rubrivivax sp.]|nr:hypothetical protein [Rubrivivax sp.]